MSERPQGECPECAYPYHYLDDLTDQEIDNLLLADMYDCETCNTILPAWAARRRTS